MDARIDSYIRQLQNLKKQTESKLYGVIYEAYDEYISHPVEERNLGMKVSIVVSKTAKLTGVQGECDKEFNAERAAPVPAGQWPRSERCGSGRAGVQEDEVRPDQRADRHCL